MAKVKPRTATKRTSKPKSVRVAKKKRGISRVQALIIVLMLAVIGVVAVALTRASGTPNYQYSWSKYCVAAYGSTSAAEVKKCKQTSAEAIVYRLYRGMYDKSPDDGGYKFWTQKFAGDRIKVSESDLVVSGTAKMGSDTAFVKAVYANMLDREPSSRDLNSWQTKLKQKKITRAKLITQFAVSSEAIRKNEDRWTAFAARAPRVDVVQTAAQNQRKRFDAMYNDYQQPAKADAEAAAAALTTAKQNLDLASKYASVNPPSTSDLQAIAATQTAAARAYDIAQSRASAAAAKEAAAKRLYDRAKAVADFSTDIKDNTVYGMNKIGDRYRATKQYAISAASYASSAKARVNDIAGKYSVAKKNFDAEVARAAKQSQACTKQNYSVGVGASYSKNGKTVRKWQDVIYKPAGKGCNATRTAQYEAVSAKYTVKGIQGQQTLPIED